jgi:hypothetical protein
MLRNLLKNCVLSVSHRLVGVKTRLWKNFPVRISEREGQQTGVWVNLG